MPTLTISQLPDVKNFIRFNLHLLFLNQLIMFKPTEKQQISKKYAFWHYFFTKLFQFIFLQSSIRYSLLCALTVWTTWLIILQPNRAISNLIAHWEFAFTMMFGSMVAGATSMGGGAVAFPALTK